MATVTTKSPGLRREDFKFVDAKKFGAALDGTTDDTTKVQAALSSGEAITFNGRTAKITAALTVSKSLVDAKFTVPAASITGGAYALTLDATAANIHAEVFRDIQLIGNDTCSFMEAVCTAPYTISLCSFDGLYAHHLVNGLYVHGTTAANEFYKNEIKRVRGTNISGFGMKSRGCVYNSIDNVEMTYMETTAGGASGYSFDLEGLSMDVRSLSADAPMRLVLESGSKLGIATVETIHASAAINGVDGAVFYLIGAGLIVDHLAIINVDPAKTSVGVSAFSTQCQVGSLIITGTVGPTYWFYPQESSSGIVRAATVAGAISGFKANAFADHISGWDFGSLAYAISEKITTGRKVVGSLPTPAARLRGSILTVEGGAGVADVTSICRKNAADAYEWGAL